MSTASEAFDAALAAWLSRQAAAEERLTSFAFREGQPAIGVPAPSSHAELRRWILASLADPQVETFLELLDADGQRMAELAEGGAFGLEPGDRIALAARVGVLTASGLVARDLERDRVALTELGRAALALAVGAGGTAGLSPAPIGTPAR